MIAILPGAETTQPVILLDNIITRATSTVPTNEIAGGLFAYALTDETYDKWSLGGGVQFCTVNLPSSENANCFCIAGHNLGSLGATLRFFSSPDLVTAHTLIMSVLITDDNPVMFLTPVKTGQSFIIGVISPAASLPFISVVKIGMAIPVPGILAAPYLPINLAKRVELMGSVSIGGHFMPNSVINKGGETAIKISLVPRSFVDGSMKQFTKAYNEGRAFFWAGSPSVFSEDIGYCRRGPDHSELRPEYGAGGFYTDIGFEVQAYGA